MYISGHTPDDLEVPELVSENPELDPEEPDLYPETISD